MSNSREPAMNHPPRPAWIEIDLDQLRRNFDLINRDKPPALRILSVIKDEAYGHGAEKIARTGQAAGVSALAVATLDEALRLRAAGIAGPLLLLGERPEAELPLCVEENLTCCVHHEDTARALADLAKSRHRTVPVQVEIDTGMSRYGVRWTAALPLLKTIASTPSLILEGVMSHFAMSDEVDKTFARLQASRFQEVLDAMPPTSRFPSGTFATAADFWTCPKHISTWSGSDCCPSGFTRRRPAGALTESSPS